MVTRNHHFPNFLFFWQPMGNSRSFDAFCREQPAYRGGRLHCSAGNICHMAQLRTHETACYLFPIHFPLTRFSLVSFSDWHDQQENINEDGEVTACENPSIRNRTDSSHRSLINLKCKIPAGNNRNPMKSKIYFKKLNNFHRHFSDFKGHFRMRRWNGL